MLCWKIIAQDTNSFVNGEYPSLLGMFTLVLVGVTLSICQASILNVLNEKYKSVRTS